jgi:hypothetical protein
MSKKSRIRKKRKRQESLLVKDAQGKVRPYSHKDYPETDLFTALGSDGRVYSVPSEIFEKLINGELILKSDSRWARVLREIESRVKSLDLYRNHEKRESRQETTQRQMDPSKPPQLGEKALLLILPKKDQDCILGDLAEEYKAHQSKYGPRFAKVWYYKQVIGSAWPLIRKSIRLGVIVWIGNWIRKLI